MMPVVFTENVATCGAAAPRPSLAMYRLGRLAYGAALALQEAQLAASIAGRAGPAVLLVEHPSVYTLGRGADAADLRGAPERLDIPVYRVGRGGGATYHGPGQMVAYPIIRLSPGGRDVHRYVRALESALIDVCARWGVVAVARPGDTGVWVGERKIASIGIGVRRGVTYHGVALNVSTDLAYFDHIVPCRMARLRFVNLTEFLPSPPSVAAVGEQFAASLAPELGLAGIETVGW
jgi:lipoyl(octanoyl) transferase